MPEIRTGQVSEGAQGVARRDWRPWWLAAALLGTAGVIGLLLSSTGRHKKVTNINRASFEQITLGMSKEQVVGLLGAPPGSYTSGPVMVTLKDLPPAPGEMERQDWRSDDAAITLAFDKDGKVVGTLFNGAAIPPAPPTLADRLWAFLKKLSL